MQVFNLVDQMESCLQQMDLMPNKDSSDPGILKLESQFLDMCSTCNVVDSALYILPVFHNGQLFVRYMEQGIYKGFTSKFKSVLTQKYNIPMTKFLPWMVYTDKDFFESSVRRKYSSKNQTSRGFEQLMYRNKTSVGELISSLKPKLCTLHCVIYIQKKNARPTHQEDR